MRKPPPSCLFCCVMEPVRSAVLESAENSPKQSSDTTTGVKSVDSVAVEAIIVEETIVQHSIAEQSVIETVVGRVDTIVETLIISNVRILIANAVLHQSIIDSIRIIDVAHNRRHKAIIECCCVSSERNPCRLHLSLNRLASHFSLSLIASPFKLSKISVAASQSKTIVEAAVEVAIVIKVG